jgi:DNA-binding transcriptional regulator LsrR (DeoR family)
MPRRKQARRADVKDLRSILRLGYEQGLSVRAVSERLQLSKTTVSTYLLRARGGAVRLAPAAAVR